MGFLTPCTDEEEEEEGSDVDEEEEEAEPRTHTCKWTNCSTIFDSVDALVAHCSEAHIGASIVNLDTQFFVTSFNTLMIYRAGRRLINANGPTAHVCKNHSQNATRSIIICGFIRVKDLSGAP